jgi:hypothetical protein
MSVNGVSVSPLLARAIVGDQSRVPIGAPVITNRKSLNSKDIQALITDTDLTEPLLNHFEVFAEEGNSAFRDVKKDSVDYRVRGNNNERMIAEYSFDPASGALVMVRRNKDVEQVSGFMRQADYGIGPTGPRGLPGRDGKDGHDGRDGKVGDTGCEGPEGKPGTEGIPGNEANPGLVGPTGPDGCEGSSGDRGMVGPVGRNGFEGARGLTGPSCPEDTNGDPGPSGEPFGRGVLFGLAMLSDPLAAIVGLDDDGIDAAAPICGWDGNSCPEPAPPPTPAPPTSVPEVPAPVPSNAAGVELCSSSLDMPPVKTSCGSTATAWTTAWVQYDAAGQPLGVSMLPLARQNTLAWPNSVVLCGTLKSNAEYTFEMTTPQGVGATLFVDCVIVLQNVDYAAGTVRHTITTTKRSSVRLRFLNNQERIPTWCGLKIYATATGELLYHTGKNSVAGKFDGEFAAIRSDSNWFGNAGVQQYP